MATITKDLSFCLSWVSKTQPNHQTKLKLEMVCSCWFVCLNVCLFICLFIFILLFYPPLFLFLFLSLLIVDVG